MRDEDIQNAHNEAVGDQDYIEEVEPDKTTWAGFTPEEKKKWLARAAAAISTFVAWAAKEHPELKIKKTEIHQDLKGCEEMGAVAYVTGDECFNVGMELYDEAAAGMPGYQQKPWGDPARDAEWERYEYFESEIGALVREHTYWHGSEDLNKDGTVADDEQNPLGAPLDLLDHLLKNMAEQWAPNLRAAYVTGMARRFRADPRVTDQAAAAFEASCTSVLGVTP
ncbi:MAG TPA: hypothetical protein QGF58_14085 [Myxococcota bacterium]|nr:hypothetical protein [Myxococcota bacterium]